ncbi:MAG: hypothetical protein LUH07_02690 [Lachnospiraceae bacterium]|nr:hypothetical protein [Lachnospiraceae bacterium]
MSENTISSTHEHNPGQSNAETELLRTLSDAEKDVTAEHIAPVKNTFSDIRNELIARKSVVSNLSHVISPIKAKIKSATPRK